ncbi:DHH family phosphoesterase [Mycoplasmopsis equigenitalium]|uniref:DHH family phosphoesterase n=1 Tax=Mycoplasmopsis equigenitalium TaxID=114883 RepID=A0ABY5J247_9BACT|nr:DHH family phosphoesterase [Mycoplasmopsis equigenitalium]UUD36843.1 DHH family phosphoesterase [Mycoplasmopsis equigenitalium]
MKKWLLWTLTASISVLLVTLMATAVAVGLEAYKVESITSSVLVFLWIFLITDVVFVLVGFIFLIKKYNRDYYKNNALNHYIDHELSDAGLGIIIFDYKKRIIYESDFIRNVLRKTSMGKKINELFDFLDFSKTANTYYKEINNYSLDIMLIPRKNMIIIKDISKESNLVKFYYDQRIVIGEVEIDNFQYYRSLLNEEQIFFMKASATKFLETMSKEFNFLYRQYADGKYIIITYEDSLNKMIENQFKFLEELQYNVDKNLKNIQLTLSIGIASLFHNLSELLEMANHALQLTQNRGGNQVTVVKNNQPNLYFGSQTEIVVDTSRTKVKLISTRLKETLEKKSVSDVFIYGHKISDLDALGSAFGLWYIATNIFNKKAYIIGKTYDKTSENMLKAMQGEALLDNLISPNKAHEMMDRNSVILMTDVNDPLRTENDDFFKKVNFENIFVIDHHRVSTTLNYLNSLNAFIDPYASSASEIVTDMYRFLVQEKDMDVKIAQLLLNGIYTDTNKFRKATSSKTFDASSYLEKNGAQTIISSEYMKHTEENEVIIRKIMDNLEEVRPGYFLAYLDQVMPSDTISIAADEILKVFGRKASFVVGKIDDKQYKLSIRSVDKNIQIIAEALGGGGHFNSAAVTTNEDLEVFLNNIRQAIASDKEIK